MTPVLGYWRIRGLAAPIRLLLEQANVKFEEKHYDCGPRPHFHRPEWLEDKFKLGLQFPNLPYYIDDQVRLSQSRVILRYLARRHKLDGDNEHERLQADLAETQAADFHQDYVKVIAMNKNFARNTPVYLETLSERLAALAQFLGDKKFIVADHVTYADFTLFEFLESQLAFSSDCLRSQPSLEEYLGRVRDLDSVRRYFESPRAIRRPFFGAPAYVDGPHSS